MMSDLILHALVVLLVVDRVVSVIRARRDRKRSAEARAAGRAASREAVKNHRAHLAAEAGPPCL